ncbi:class I adenylate-forming enzyme family protein [Amycolatopsis sp. WGS_07]|uniref:class I adenylate-forming enzyme family protein n=1 Tax=Amycolatopsis sp. WGS_07 TaxID=3076764 RepID=UPI0038734253
MLFLHDCVRRWASERPFAVAVSAAEAELSYADLAELVEDGAARLRSAGIRPGERVVLAGINTPGWVVAFLAALRCGAVVVPLNSRLGAEQVPALLADVEPALVLADDTQASVFAAAGLGPRLVSLGAGLPAALDSLPPAPRECPPPDLDAGSPAILSFTSGTTSAPKGALISHGSILAGAKSWLDLLPDGQDALTTVLVPLFHNTGYVDQLAHLIVAGGQVDLVPRFRTDAAVAAMTRRPPTLVVAVPTILRMLMLREEADRIFGACTAAGYGGSPMPVAWAREFADRWPKARLMYGYGLTEFTSLSHVLDGPEVLEHGDSVGRPVLGARCEIRDDTGAAVPAGTAGEVWLAGPQRMLGYWRNPDADAKALAGEWLRTGDRGVLDEAGRLRLRGRMDDVINRGGEKILPAAVEEVLSEDEALADVAVFGLPDPVLGQRVAVAVVPRPGETFDPVAARENLGKRLPDYAWPSQFVVLDEMPLAATGKADRRRLAALASGAAEPSGGGDRG